MKIRDDIIKLFNRIFRKYTTQRIVNVTKENYDEYHTTYDTLFKVSKCMENLDAYLIGGISAAIQTNQDLYRENSDIDIMCNEKDLSKLIEILTKSGYSVADKRGIKTENFVDNDGKFHAKDHELNANTENLSLLGIGIFTYQEKGNEVIMHSYAYHEKEGKVIGTEKVIPRELF